MSSDDGPAPNSLSFEMSLREVIAKYQSTSRQRIISWQIRANPNFNPRTDFDDALEAHIRDYIIDPLLEALSWSTNENLMIESFIRSPTTSEVRRLDYLGIEKGTDNPLLVVEAKRPDAPLPTPKKAGPEGRAFRYPDLLASALSTLKQSGTQKKANISKTWGGWLTTLIDYVRALHRMPVKVVTTNGDWLIVFEDPENAFDENADVDASRISVYENRARILQNAVQVFRSLHYHSLVPNSDPIDVAQVLAIVPVSEVGGAMHALTVTYNSVHTGLRAVPSLYVVPELILFRKLGGWLRVRSRESFLLPHKPSEMSKHLADVRSEQRHLFDEVARLLGHTPPLRSVADSYSDGWLGTQVKPVVSTGSQASLAVLGSATHFILEANEYRGCGFHSAANAAAAGAAIEAHILAPSAQHVANFGDHNPFHCAHRTMRHIREAEVSAMNRSNFSSRNEVEDGVFCKVWRFERYLCCKACVFRDACHTSLRVGTPCRLN